MSRPRWAERIAELQRELLGAVGTQGEPMGPGQYVRVARAALESVSVIGRHAADEPPVTGWQIDPARSAGSDAGLYGQFDVAELMEERPVWAVAVALPVGWSFRCVGNTIVEARSPEGSAYDVMLSVDL
jgi:hypothetical protein